MSENDIVLTYDPVEFGVVEVQRVVAGVSLASHGALASAEAATPSAALAAHGATEAAARSTSATLAATTTNPEVSA
jgi:hypothetical protein